MTQTLFQTDLTVGNCLQACVATLLELPLEQVPHFGTYDDWDARLHGFVLERGFWMRRMNDADVVFGMQYGMSPRGHRHAVAFINGGMWDPHPSRQGLVSIDACIEFVPVKGSSRP